MLHRAVHRYHLIKTIQPYLTECLALIRKFMDDPEIISTVIGIPAITIEIRRNGSDRFDLEIKSDQ